MFWPKKVKQILKKLDIEKTNGPDSIPARVLKEAAPELAKPLAKLFQLCFNRGITPKQWKVAHVITVQYHQQGEGKTFKLNNLEVYVPC